VLAPRAVVPYVGGVPQALVRVGWLLQLAISRTPSLQRLKGLSLQLGVFRLLVSSVA